MSKNKGWSKQAFDELKREWREKIGQVSATNTADTRLAKGDWASKLPKVASKARTRSICVHYEGFLYESAANIESLLDADPISVDMAFSTGELMMRRNELLSLTNEVQYLNALNKIFRERGYEALADLCIAELELLSLRATRGGQAKLFVWQSA